MELSLGSLGVSFALGAFFLLGIGLVLELCKPGYVSDHVKENSISFRHPESRRIRHIPGVVAYPFLLALSIVIGLVARDVSDWMDDNLRFLLSPFPSESVLRKDVLQDSASLCNEYTKARGKVGAKLSELGVEQALANVQCSSQPELGVLESLCKKEFDVFEAKSGSWVTCITAPIFALLIFLLWYSSVRIRACWLAMLALVLFLGCHLVLTCILGGQGGDIDAVYYVAKNEVFMEDTYYEDLTHYQARIDFARAFSFCSIILGLVSLPAFAKWLFSVSGDLRDRRFLYLHKASAAFFLAYLCGRLAYTAEEREFDRRVFGYFLNVVHAEQERRSGAEGSAKPCCVPAEPTTSSPHIKGDSFVA